MRCKRQLFWDLVYHLATADPHMNIVYPNMNIVSSAAIVFSTCKQPAPPVLSEPLLISMSLR